MSMINFMLILYCAILYGPVQGLDIIVKSVTIQLPPRCGNGNKYRESH